MYYRVATQVDGAAFWQWKSTALSSLDTLFQFLRLFRTLPHDQLRIFSSFTKESLAEQLEQENKGLASTSVTATRFLEERMILPQSVLQGTSAHDGGKSLERGAIAVISHQAVNERGGQCSAPIHREHLERRREELESGPGGDHDMPYSFMLPLSLPQVRAWMALLAKVQKGELNP
jgi:hypothetical protein